MLLLISNLPLVICKHLFMN